MHESHLSLATLKQLSPFEFKNILGDEARNAHVQHVAQKGKERLLNTGRGNPNFLNTTVRNAFAYLELFVSHLSSGYLSQSPDLGLRPKKEGIAKKLDEFLASKGSVEEILFLKRAIQFAIDRFHFNPDEFVFELVDATVGDYYPNPPRILEKTEEVVKAYLDQIIGFPSGVNKQKIELFATEGASAAMIYLFNSLKINRIVKEGDEIAIWTPIFAPYLELPLLSSYKLKTTYIESKAELDWQVSDQELEKLKNPKIKALFVVNPTNPASVAIDKKIVKKIADIVKNHNKDLIIIADTVYCTFVEDFHCFFKEIPDNTMFIYSYSKYFGVTGWRLGVMLLTENNIFDRLLARLPEADKKMLHERYKLVTPEPGKFRFIDRLESDSREESLAHTGGLSCPQQAIMCLFSLFHLMDEKLRYKKMVREILVKRAQTFYSNLGIPMKIDPNNAYYYCVIDLATLSAQKYGKAFADHFVKTVSIQEFLLELAKKKFTICLPGNGFSGPELSLRVSFANLDEPAYAATGKNLKDLLDEYHEKWKKK